MAGINKVILVGHLGGDPEMKYGSSGNAFTTFTMATSESWVKDGQKEERTEWHRIIAFGKLAEICAKWLHKGKQIYLEGKIQTRSWEQDGIKRYTTEIVAGTMQCWAVAVIVIIRAAVLVAEAKAVAKVVVFLVVVKAAVREEVFLVVTKAAARAVVLPPAVIRRVLKILPLTVKPRFPMVGRMIFRFSLLGVVRYVECLSKTTYY